jgi:TRAP-type C4-dicarboxylate transport system permease small subunit
MLSLPARAMGHLVALVAYILRASLVAAMGVMLACIAIQVVMRYVFGNAPSWSEELALLMFSWVTLGGLALGVREGFHVRLDVVLNLLPASLRRWAETAIDAVTAAFGAYLAWSGQRFVEVTGGSVSAAIGYPIEFLHALAPVAGFLICLFAVWRVITGPEAEAAPELAP